jgi:hypothetical protein
MGARGGEYKVNDDAVVFYLLNKCCAFARVVAVLAQFWPSVASGRAKRLHVVCNGSEGGK